MKPDGVSVRLLRRGAVLDKQFLNNADAVNIALAGGARFQGRTRPDGQSARSSTEPCTTR
jgi:hypothetical protein